MVRPHAPDETAAHVSSGYIELGPPATWSDLDAVPPVPYPPLRRPRLGWSLAIATVANLILGTVAMLSGAMLVGVVACSALSIATCLLVLAEIACRYGIDPLDDTPRAIDDRR
ncbi:MAG: hypothetical protein AAF547_08745 [Actinomycetota bacterium]